MAFSTYNNVYNTTNIPYYYNTLHKYGITLDIPWKLFILFYKIIKNMAFNVNTLNYSE